MSLVWEFDLLVNHVLLLFICVCFGWDIFNHGFSSLLIWCICRRQEQKVAPDAASVEDGIIQLSSIPTHKVTSMIHSLVSEMNWHTWSWIGIHKPLFFGFFGFVAGKYPHPKRKSILIFCICYIHKNVCLLCSLETIFLLPIW